MKQKKGANQMKKKIRQAVTYIIIYLAVEAVVMQSSLYIINNLLRRLDKGGITCLQLKEN